MDAETLAMKSDSNDESIKPGSTLLVETPYVYALKSKLRTLHCDYCFKRTKVLRCSACKYVYYCRPECQKNSWTDHKFECPNLKSVFPRVVPDAARLMAKIIFKLMQGGDKENGVFTTNYRNFSDLMSHHLDLKQDDKRMEHFNTLYALLYEYIGPGRMPNMASLLGIYGRMCVNGFNILDSEMLSIGTGIYLEASVIDHSCDPNAVAVFQGVTLHIRAVKAMAVLDWTKVRISYIELLNTPKVRQHDLKATYYFLCDCSRCQDIEELKLMNSAQCPNRNCPTPIFVENDATQTQHLCRTCGYRIKAEVLKEYDEVAKYTIQQLELMVDIAYLDVCKVCLEKQRGLFHPLNLWHIKVLDLAFESSIEMGQWHQAEFLGMQLLPGYRHYYKVYHPLHGIFHLKLGKIHLFLEHVESALTQLQEAQSILQVTHGEEHTLYREQLLPLLEQARTELASR